MTIFIRRAEDGIWNKSVKFGSRFCYTAAAFLLPSFAFAFTPTYTLTDLGLPKGATEAFDGKINNLAQAVGDAAADFDQATLFANGKATEIIPGSVQSVATGINVSEKVSGYFSDANGTRGFIYNKGKITAFSVPQGTSTLAESINDLGQVAGSFMDANSVDHVFIRQPNGAIQDLGGFGEGVGAPAINNQGRVLINQGTRFTNSGFISRPGSTSLESIPPIAAGGWVVPMDMNQVGVVIGSVAIDSTNTVLHAFTYFNGKLKDLGTVHGFPESAGIGINAMGQTVGMLLNDAAGIEHGWVNVDGKMRDLNGLLNASGKGWVVTEAVSINDLGRVLANAKFNNGLPHIVLLTPNAVLPNLVP
jgi:uncharacterized membrane protein